MDFVILQKGGKMANITLPIQVNLPEDWIEQIIERLRNDPEVEWVEIIHCKDCAHYGGYGFCYEVDGLWHDEDYCSRAERREK